MDNGPESKGRSFGNFWIWLAVAIPLYVLSIGPVAKISVATHVGPGMEKVLEIIYFPVLKGAEWTGKEDLLEAYLKFWGVE